jgi:hypothetical protein
MLRGKSPNPQMRESKPRPTSAHAKVTRAFKLPLTDQIPPLIKPYQAPIPFKISFYLPSHLSRDLVHQGRTELNEDSSEEPLEHSSEVMKML